MTTALEDANALLGLNAASEEELRELIKDGQLLCNKIREIHPCCRKDFKVNNSKMAFKQMENIGNYCKAAQGFGIPDQYCFVTVDLYEGNNMKQVVLNLSQVYQKAKSEGKL